VAGEAKRIADRVWLVGGDGLSAPGDCLCYALDLGALVLVDCGVGPGWERIRGNLAAAGLDPAALAHLVLTHCHIDHAGAAAAIAAETGCRVIAHALDAEALEEGDRARSAADWYGASLAKVAVTRRIAVPDEALELPQGALHLLHTPGHTPGSLAAWIDLEGPRGTTRILFGQDVHGPLHRDFGSDRADWQRSLRRLIALDADVLCEGHYGVIRGRDEVRRFIEDFLED
jgi:glyoxylase-like metal-dependent hydrolase (beta-lactamase superfamily II)